MIKGLTIVAVAGLLAAAAGTPASAHHPLPSHTFALDPFGHHGRILRRPTAAERRSASQAWTPVTAPAPFGSNGAGTAVLLTDGTVLVNDNEASWYKLTPDINGNYINGTWTQMASLPAGYGPLYFADAILPDGRLLIEGGEYNFFRSAETNQGAIYDPVANAWTSVAPPSGWDSIGDASSVILPNGTFMLGNCCYSNQALFDESNLSWTLTGAGKADGNSEEGWSLMPNGNVLTVDVGLSESSEYYTPSTGSWQSAGNTIVELPDYYEMGPQVLLNDGKIFAAGASGATATYDPKDGRWKKVRRSRRRAANSSTSPTVPAACCSTDTYCSSRVRARTTIPVRSSNTTERR